ncbi:MAG: type I restriction-modification enzyme R subunit C-terminal domain-containing protein [Leptospirales bacterium]
MINGELKSKVNKIWEAFWSGGVSNPLTVIEQITYLLFIKRLDELHTAKESKANRLKKPIKDPIFDETNQNCRWNKFKGTDPQHMYDNFWVNITLPALEEIRLKFRDLINFLDSTTKDPIFTNYEDEFQEGYEVEDFIKADANLETYRRKVARYVKEHQDHITIHKLRLNQPITKTDLQELEKILIEDCEFTSEKELNAVLGEEKLGEFIRSIVGLEINAAKEAFSAYLATEQYSPNQISFINLIIDHLVRNGIVDPDTLYEAPFTDQNTNGLDGIFPGKDANKIISIITSIRKTGMGIRNP